MKMNTIIIVIIMRFEVKSPTVSSKRV